MNETIEENESQQRPEGDQGAPHARDDGDDFASEDNLWRHWRFFYTQAQLLQKAYPRILKSDHDIAHVVGAMVYGIMSSCDSMYLIVEKQRMRECMMIGRCIFEGIVNACFVCAEGEAAAIRAELHAKQKMYRDMSRELECGGIRMRVWTNAELNPATIPEMTKAALEFTSRRGREIASWTPENVPQKIERIAGAYGKDVAGPLAFSLLAIYRHASEIIHGTYFGALFSVHATAGMAKPGSPDELLSLHRGQIVMILLLLALNIRSLLDSLDRHFPVSDLRSASHEPTIVPGISDERASDVAAVEETSVANKPSDKAIRE